MPMLWVVGDSWSDPTFDGNATAGWPWLVASRLGVGLHNCAQAGSGYLNTSNPAGWNFPAQVARFPCPSADVAVVFGSVNDLPWPPSGVQAVAPQVLAAVRAAAPRARLLVIGPQHWSTPPPEIGPLVTAVSAAADQARALFVDASQWMAGHPELIGADNHPNPAGHAYLAALIGPLVARLLYQGPEPAPVDRLTFPATFPA